MSEGSASTSGNAPAAGAENKKSKAVVFALLFIVLILAGGAVGYYLLNPEETPEEPKPVEPVKVAEPSDNSFAASFLKKSYEAQGENKNNLIVSPYSMEAAWRTAYAGAQGDTKTEIEEVFGDRVMPEFPQLKNANALFLRETYQDALQASFKNSFIGDLRIDPMDSPDPINAWVSEKTDGMINSVLNEAPAAETIMMIINAVAMDEKWADEFECDDVSQRDFVRSDGETMQVSMMSGDANSYFETGNAKGIVREYKASDDGSAFEFVGILPNGDVNDYLSRFSTYELSVMADKEIEDGADNGKGGENVVTVNLPKFTYTSDVLGASDILRELGIKTAFDGETADFGAMFDLSKLNGQNVYVGKVMQRAFVDLSESGTKAAAVTVIPMDGTTSVHEDKNSYYNVTFDRPFVYLIRDKETKEIVFEGVVEMPSEWQEVTCEATEE